MTSFLGIAGRGWRPPAKASDHIEITRRGLFGPAKPLAIEHLGIASFASVGDTVINLEGLWNEPFKALTFNFYAEKHTSSSDMEFVYKREGEVTFETLSSVHHVEMGGYDDSSPDVDGWVGGGVTGTQTLGGDIRSGRLFHFELTLFHYNRTDAYKVYWLRCHYKYINATNGNTSRWAGGWFKNGTNPDQDRISELRVDMDAGTMSGQVAIGGML